MTDWSITQLAPALGARIDGVSLASASACDFDRLHDLLDEYGVLALPDQVDFTAETHVRVGEAFGEPFLHPFLDAIPDHPAILQVLKEPDDAETFGGEHWHCDISFVSPPAAVSVLYGIEIPPIGGDTLFASTTEAYARLSAPMRTLVDQLTATHVYPDRIESPETAAVHPVVRVHPRTGRRSLYVNPAFVGRINELERDESDALLAFLFAHQTRPEFQARVAWTARQVLLWDNRTTVHYALNDYAGHRRRLQRVTAMESPI